VHRPRAPRPAGARKKGGTDVHHSQRSRPGPVDLEKVKAEFENGVLTIIVPKLAQEKGRKVQILEK
jgi:hypothetical protein